MIHPNDQQLVDYINPTPEGPWIAGGAALKWYLGESIDLSDVDVFFANDKQFDTLYTFMRGDDWHSSYMSDNAITMKDMSWGKRKKVFDQTVQLIKKRFYSSAKDVIDNFDISVCQVAFDGEKFIYGETTLQDVKDKKFRIVSENTHILKRTIKYMTYGFSPEQSVIDSIKKDTAITDFTGIHDYDFVV